MCHSVNWHKTSAVVCQQTHPCGRKNWKQWGLRGPFPPPVGLQPGCAVREHDKVMQVVLHGWKFISLKWADLLKRYMSGAGRKYSQPTLCSALCAQCQSLDLLTPWKHWCCWWRAACPLPLGIHSLQHVPVWNISMQNHVFLPEMAHLTSVTVHYACMGQLPHHQTQQHQFHRQNPNH